MNQQHASLRGLKHERRAREIPWLTTHHLEAVQKLAPSVSFRTTQMRRGQCAPFLSAKRRLTSTSSARVDNRSGCATSSREDTDLELAGAEPSP